MQIIKKSMYVFVCCLIVTLSFVFPISAADDVIFTPDDLIDFGFEFDGVDSYVYSGDDDPFNFGASFLRTSEKNFPEFDIYDDIPWETFPDYIQNIIYSPLDDLTSDSESGFYVPFVGVQVSSNVINVFVGTNVALGVINNNTLSYSIFGVPSVSSIYENCSLYRLRIGRDDGSVGSWTRFNPESFGNRGNVVRMLNWNCATSSSTEDWYLYGANGVNYPTKYTSQAFVVNDDNRTVSFIYSTEGFKSGKFIPGQDSGYALTYFQYFEPIDINILINEKLSAALSELQSSDANINSILDALFFTNQIIGYEYELSEANNGLLTEIKSLLEDFLGSMDTSGSNDFSTTLPSDDISDFVQAEDELLTTSPDFSFEDSFVIDFNDNAFDYIFDLVTRFVYCNFEIAYFIFAVLGLGMISLLLNR